MHNAITGCKDLRHMQNNKQLNIRSYRENNKRNVDGAGAFICSITSNAQHWGGKCDIFNKGTINKKI